MYKFELLFCTSLLLLSATVRCDCNLSVNGPSPLFIKNFGSRKIAFKAKGNIVKLGTDESITAYCSTNLKSDYGNLGFGKSVDLLCTSYDLQFKSVKSRQYQRLGNSNIYCGGPSRLNIYESSKSLPKCEPYSTYGIGNQIEGMADFISTAICYDLDTLSLKYAHYIAYKPSYYAVVSDESTDNTFRNNSLNIDLSKKLDDFNNYFTFMSTEAFTNALNLKKSTESLLQPFDFDYVSLLQDTPLATDVKDFGYLFNTMWLRQLRLGNWRLYLNALAERARSVQYAVYTGTHELLFMPPSSADCKTNISLTVMFEKSRVDAPAYMWSYVKSLHPDVAEEFVVIAHNSPYVKSPSSESFCEDMCDEIDWLKNSDFGKMRRNPMFGYAFCCRPEEVAEIIEHFPALEFKKLMPEPESEESTINPK